MLTKMLDTGRIRFIDILDDFDRDDIIRGYLSGGCFSKKEYIKTMEGHEMKLSFGN
jgi:hypothetical protein